MNPLRPVEIVGGGLAGLSLGIALRQRGVPVTIFESGAYPRHRVCGEFIRGLRATTLEQLGLEPHLKDALHHRDVAWFAGEVRLRRQRLASPALAISRFVLDARLAEAFRAAGGKLLTGKRAPLTPVAGRVLAHGRRTNPRSGWIGLKLHVRNLTLDRDLEMHLGADAYVGLCALPDSRVNLCGLFRRRSDVAGRSEKLVTLYLRASGLGALAGRLDAAVPEPDSFTAVAGLQFGRQARPRGAAVIGDAHAMIPPFTGNGMAMAFESAAAAVAPLLAWSRQEQEWPAALAQLGRALRRDFRVRLPVAALCHPFLLSPPRQRWLAAADRAGVLPLRLLTRLLS